MPIATQAAPPRLNAKMIMPFVESTRKVFSTMVNVATDIGRPTLKEGAAATYDVSGVIRFSGEIVGSVVVSFQMEAARKLVGAMVGSDVDPTSPDFCDAIGEIANMIAGSAKRTWGRSPASPSRR